MIFTNQKAHYYHLEHINQLNYSHGVCMLTVNDTLFFTIFFWDNGAKTNLGNSVITIFSTVKCSIFLVKQWVILYGRNAPGEELVLIR